VSSVSDERTGLGIGALELFVEVLSQSEAGAAADDFYDRLCEAVCHLLSRERVGRAPAGDGQENTRAVVQFYGSILSGGTSLDANL